MFLFNVVLFFKGKNNNKSNNKIVSTDSAITGEAIYQDIGTYASIADDNLSKIFD